MAVVTGAGSGIGRALAGALARRGAALALADVDAAALEETARGLPRAPAPRVSTHVLDVADRARYEAFAAEALAHHGRVNLLVNNAGVALIGSVAELSLDDVAWLMGVNFFGVVHGVKLFWPALEREPAAHVVNLSSIFGIIAPAGQAAYAASKFAVRGFSEALRHELRDAGSRVRVSLVHPGGIRTNIARRARLGARTGRSSHDDEIALFESVARTSPERAAERILRGVERDEERILVGPDAWALERLQRFMPVRYGRVLRRLLGRVAAPPRP